MDIKPCINEERQYDDSEVQSEEKDLSPGSNTESCETQVKEAEDETKVAVKMQLHSFVKEEMESSDGSEADGHPQVYGVQVIQPLEDYSYNSIQDTIVKEPLKEENANVSDNYEGMDIGEVVKEDPDESDMMKEEHIHVTVVEEMHEFMSVEPVSENQGQDMLYTLLVKEEL